MFRLVLLSALLLIGRVAQAGPVGGEFPSIDGGMLALSDWRGHPVLVVNTASQCGFTGQYSGLQDLQDTFGPKGLIVLAVPSNSFNQELGTADEVKTFCELNYDLTLPMTEITPVTGPQAHPFYKAVAAETGFVPTWNFNKILLSPSGEVVATYGALTRPDSRKIRRQVEALLR